MEDGTRNVMVEVITTGLDGGHPFSHLKKTDVTSGGEPKVPPPGYRIEVTISGRTVYRPIKIQKGE